MGCMVQMLRDFQLERKRNFGRVPPIGGCCFGRCGVQGRGGVTRVRPSVSVSSGPAAVRSAPGHDQRAPLSLTATPVELCPRGSWRRSARATGLWLLPAPRRASRPPSRPTRNRECDDMAAVLVAFDLGGIVVGAGHGCGPSREFGRVAVPGPVGTDAPGPASRADPRASFKFGSACRIVTRRDLGLTATLEAFDGNCPERRTEPVGCPYEQPG